MRIQLIGQCSKSLGFNIQKEGDDVVDENPDLILSDTLIKKEDKKCPVVGGEWSIPHSITSAIGIETDPRLEVDFIASKWWDHSWSGQTLVGLPLSSLMNDNLGPQCIQGYAARFVQESPLSLLFESSGLEDILKEIGYAGFISFSCSMSLSTNKDYSIVGVELGIPSRGFFNILEGIPGKISSFLTGENSHLLESWTVSLTLSRSPWPYCLKCPRTFIEGLSGATRKHLWLFNTTTYKKTIYTENSLIGVATAWARTLGEASRRTLRTLRSTTLPEKQYRTDIIHQSSQKYHLLQGRGLVGV